jgi:Ca2+-transporting ATPase
MVLTGTTVTYGRGKAVATSTGMNTEFGKIAEEVTAVKTEKTPLEKRTDEIGKWLGIISLVICFLVAGISIVRELMGGKVDLPFIVTMVMFAVSLALWQQSLRHCLELSNFPIIARGRSPRSNLVSSVLIF